MNSTEVFVNFEDIGLKVIKTSRGKLGWLLGAITFSALSLAVGVAYQMGADVEREAFAVYMLVAAVFAVGYFLTYQRAYYLTNSDNSNSIGFLLDKPTPQEFEAFLDCLKIVRKAYLLRKYGSFSKLLSFEQQYNQVQWLCSTGTISTDEYEASVLTLNSLFNAAGPITGFQSSR